MSVIAEILGLSAWGTELLGEMANIPKSIHRLPIDVKFNVLQSGKKALPHAARIKVFRKDPKKGPNFSIRLSSNPALIVVKAGDSSWLSKKDVDSIVEHIKKYRAAYIAMWHDAGMDQDELRAAMDKIDVVTP